MEDLNPSVRQQIADRINATAGLTGDYEKDPQFKEFAPKYDFTQQGANSAIQARANAKFLTPEIQNLQTQQKAEYAGKVQGQIQSAANLGMAQIRYDNARLLSAAQRRAQEEAQRAAMINSLFQVGGTIGGFMLAGPGGAVAGSQVGSAMGGPAAQQGLGQAGRTA